MRWLAHVGTGCVQDPLQPLRSLLSLCTDRESYHWIEHHNQWHEIQLLNFCYKVKGMEDECFFANSLNVLMNLQISLLAIVLTTAAGAQPPGLTAHKQTIFSSHWLQEDQYSQPPGSATHSKTKSTFDYFFNLKKNCELIFNCALYIARHLKCVNYMPQVQKDTHNNLFLDF